MILVHIFRAFEKLRQHHLMQCLLAHLWAMRTRNINKIYFVCLTSVLGILILLIKQNFTYLHLVLGMFTYKEKHVLLHKSAGVDNYGFLPKVSDNILGHNKDMHDLLVIRNHNRTFDDKMNISTKHKTDLENSFRPHPVILKTDAANATSQNLSLKTVATLDKATYQQSFFDGMCLDSSTPNNLLFHKESAKSDAEFDLAQNHAIQTALWNLQHPQSCENAKLLVLSEFHHSGFGSTLHLRAMQFMMGLDHNRVVVDDPGMLWEQTSQKKEYCNSTGFDCYFLPLSNCSVSADFRHRGALKGNNMAAIKSSHRVIFVDRMEVFFEMYKHYYLMPSNFGREYLNKTDHWWMSQLIRYIVRPNCLTVKRVIKPAFSSVFPMGVPRGLASVFIRWGDKGQEVAHLQDVASHFKSLIGSGIRHIFVGSDSQDAVDQSISMYGGRFRIYHLNVARSGSGSFRSKMIEKHGTHHIVEQVKFFLMQLFLSIQGDVMSGQLSSNWCRLEHELHDAMGKANFNYYPIGVTHY